MDDSPQSIQLEYDEYYSNRSLKLEKTLLNQKVAVYEELLQNISSENIFNKMEKARGNSKNYTILHDVSFVTISCFVRKRKKLFYNFDPYGKGTIYSLLSKSLPEKCVIRIYEPLSFDEYEFILYISWNKLTIKDKFMIRTNMKEKLMTCDIESYVLMQKEHSYQETLEKKLRRCKLSKDIKI